jgi:hypothetical protein
VGGKGAQTRQFTDFNLGTFSLRGFSTLRKALADRASHVFASRDEATHSHFYSHFEPLALMTINAMPDFVA